MRWKKEKRENTGKEQGRKVERERERERERSKSETTIVGKVQEGTRKKIFNHIYLLSPLPPSRVSVPHTTSCHYHDCRSSSTHGKC